MFTTIYNYMLTKFDGQAWTLDHNLYVAKLPYILNTWVIVLNCVSAEYSERYLCVNVNRTK